ncbi:MAG: hypothetical protein HY302_15845 [Opitutae bacterium]|nr:hypothetical protein [Opitutae bacterium]
MNTAGQIVRKDLRRFWGLAALATGLMALDACNGYFGFTAIIRPSPGLDVVLALIKWPVVFLFVVGLVQEDAVGGTQAFWLTRPVEPLGLLGGKLAVAAVTLVLPYALGQAGLACAIGSSAPVAFFIGVEATGLMTAVVVAAALLGALTRSLLHACAVVLGGLVLLLLLLALSGQIDARLVDFLPAFSSQISATTRLVAGFGFGLVGLLVALQAQYRRRRPAVTAALVVGTAVAAFFGGGYFPLQLVAEPSPPAAPARVAPAAPAPGVAITLQGPAYEAGFSRFYDRQAKRAADRRFVAVPVQISPPEAGRFVSLKTATSALTYADGTRRTFARVNSGVSENRMALAALKAALGLSTGPRPNPSYSSRLNLFSLDPAENPVPPTRPARLEVQLGFTEFAYAVEAALPLARGATLTRNGETWRLDTVRFDAQGQLVVEARQMHATSLLYPKGRARPDRQFSSTFLHAVVLHNRRLNEFSIGRSEYPRPAFDSGGFVAEQRLAHKFSTVSSPDPDKPGPRLDARWIADAELLILALHSSGDFTQTLTVENFFLRHLAESPPPFWQQTADRTQ